ncbi:chaperonin 10-like protein [Microdochium trichocladiopsis]|uniref:Chaperonin 10-like protein n=1 Tax=Microdochium trichocladiopsis TaxID=1682393 RepID=A0A9P8YKT6_9PEZI|nr:chaperonin 10-like protein [Microdochium trichocladiopsis]KAH7040839.1 chaperonin 10-like protein [Microdochium trichocladiopsis]
MSQSSCWVRLSSSYKRFSSLPALTRPITRVPTYTCLPPHHHHHHPTYHQRHRQLCDRADHTSAKMTSTMRALVTTEDHKATVKEIPKPTPGEGEILVKVHYAAQNPTDWKGVASAPPGVIVGCDFAGTVASPSSRWREGQRVAGFVFGNNPSPKRGAYAEYLVIEETLVFPIPNSISFAEAATVPLPLATASQALFQRLGLPEPSKPAKSAFPVLVNGGTSSVGKYAVQLCKLGGLYVIATGSRKNHDLLTSLGVDAVVDYADDNWPEKVRELSHDNLQHAFDCISEENTTPKVAQALSSTKGGHVLCILPRKTSELPQDLQRKVKVESTIVYTVFGRPIKYGTFDNCSDKDPRPQDKAHWEKVLSEVPEWLESGKLKPNRVKEAGGLDDVLEGFKLHQEGRVSAEKLVYKIA